jgi:hypothetical protein
MPNQSTPFARLTWYSGRAEALAIAFLIATGTLVYGVFASSLGFYYDDWPVIWVYQTLGPRGVASYFAGERPVFGWLYSHLVPILGISPTGWQVAAFAVRSLSSVVLFVAFCALWPRRKDVAWLTATIVLLYPGFTQQPIAFTYLSQHLSFLFFSISLAATIFSFTRPAYRWLFLFISLVTEACSYLLMEYFVGLEFLRLFIIIILINDGRITRELKRLFAALKMWSPYVVVWIAYLVWRTSIFRVASYYGTESYKDAGSHVAQILSRPLHEILVRVLNVIHNILMSTAIAWARPFGPDLVSVNPRPIHSWMIAAIVAVTGICTMRSLMLRTFPIQTYEPSHNDPRRALKSGLFLGVAGLIFAGFPFVLPNLGVGFGTHPSFVDRFTLPFMLPSALTLSCLIFISTRRIPKILLISGVLFGFSAFQVENARIYREDWYTQKSLFWQIAWRAPQLKPGTSVFADGMPRSLFGNHSAGNLDLLYEKSNSEGRLHYFIFDLTQLTARNSSFSGAKLSYRPSDPISGRVHQFEFQGTTDQCLVAWISPTGTLRIITQPTVDEILRGSALTFNLAQFSQPDKTISGASGSPNGPLLKIVGAEPNHDWTYFYQKAELERQFKNWNAVGKLGDEVISKGYKPNDPSEWFPFIDGYTRIHRYRIAADMSISMLEECPDALAALSSLWQRVKNEDTPNSPELNSALGVLRGKLMLRDGQ